MAESRGRQIGAPICRNERPNRALAGVLAIVLAIGILAGACGRDTSAASKTTTSKPPPENVPIVAPPDQAVRGGQLVEAVEDETNGWNPANNEWAASGLTIAHSFFDTLTAYDADKNIQPFLLESFTPNKDFTRWTLQLRPGIKFSNGKPVTAEAVAKSQTFFQRSVVLGGAYTTVDSFTATGPLTIEVKTNTPDASFPTLLSTQIGVVADPEWVESNDGLRPIGTGPFVLQEWRRGDRLTVSANPNYWRTDSNGARLPYLDKVEFRIMPDPESRSAALVDGTVDVMQSTDAPTTESFVNRDKFHLYTDPAANAKQMAMLNTQAPPFDDLDARRALAFGTDVKAYQSELKAGSGVIVDSPFGPTSKWHVDTDYPEFDQAKARELVEKVKARNGGVFAFTLTASDDPIAGSIAAVLQKQWEAIGVNVSIVQEPLATQIIKIVTGNYQAQLWLQFDAPDPSNEIWWWDQTHAVAPPTFSLNFARIKDTAIGEAIKKARSTTDERVRHEAWAEVQQRMAALAPYVWLGEEKKVVIAGDNVVNLTNWTLPNGKPALGLMQGGQPSIAQVWVKRR